MMLGMRMLMLVLLRVLLRLLLLRVSLWLFGQLIFAANGPASSESVRWCDRFLGFFGRPESEKPPLLSAIFFLHRSHGFCPLIIIAIRFLGLNRRGRSTGRSGGGSHKVNCGLMGVDGARLSLTQGSGGLISARRLLLLIILRFLRPRWKVARVVAVVVVVVVVVVLVVVRLRCGCGGKAGRVQGRVLRRGVVWPPVAHLLGVQERLLGSIFVEQL